MMSHHVIIPLLSGGILQQMHDNFYIQANDQIMTHASAALFAFDLMFMSALEHGSNLCQCIPYITWYKDR